MGEARGDRFGVTGAGLALLVLIGLAIGYVASAPKAPTSDPRGADPVVAEPVPSTPASAPAYRADPRAALELEEDPFDDEPALDAGALDEVEAAGEAMAPPLSEAQAEAYRDRYAEGLRQLRERFGVDP